ncbi:hypothetical protein Pcinc_023712, partial [Petrolisthes cinctipes]
VPKTFVDFNYNYDYYPEPGTDPPSFTARPQTFTVEMGQSVIIPCDFTNPGVNKLIIKKMPASGGSEKLLTVGTDKVAPDPRISITGSRLTISHTRPRDAGTFLCHFDVEPPVQLRHQLDVQYAPNVRALVPPEQHVARGKTITLECQAHGNPEPIIRWSRQGGTLPSGRHTSQGSRLTLENVDRRAEGTYLCTADNGIGDPASTAMTITIEYPPEVNPEKAVVRTGEGDKVKLVCIVHGRPPPDVVWTHDGRPLPDVMMDTQLHRPSQTTHTRAHTAHDFTATHSPAHRHSLDINPVTEKDFGAYVCIAENAHGQKNAVIQVTGLPEPPEITSSPNGGESTRYTLTWKTESYYPITDFIIKYRRAHLGIWQVSLENRQRNHTMVMAGSWDNVSRSVENEVVVGGAPQSMAFTLAKLEVATDYLAVVRVRNKYGWSAESEHFHFSTKKAMAVLQSTSGTSNVVGVSCLSPQLLLLSMSLLLPLPTQLLQAV